MFKVISGGFKLAKAIKKMISSFKELQEELTGLQKHIGLLLNLLASIKRADTLKDPDVAWELQTSLANLQEMLEEVGEKCAALNFKKAWEALKNLEGKKGTRFERFKQKIKEAMKLAELGLGAESKKEILDSADQRLKLALHIVQVGFSVTQVRQIHRFGIRMTTEFHNLNFVTDDTQEVYTDPYGIEIPNAVINVKAEVNKQRLIVSWKGSSSDLEGTKYEIKYHDTKHLTVICTKSPVALGSQRVKPWQDYAIQVRAVNNAGASPWSFPPVYIRMNEGAPNNPGLVVVETITRHSLKVTAQSRPPIEQGVKKVIIEKKEMKERDGTQPDVQWHQYKTYEINDNGEYMIDRLEFMTAYLIRVRYQNKFDISEPSAAIAVKIKDMIPTVPRDLQLFRSGILPEVRFKPPSVNPGAIEKYEIKIQENTPTSQPFSTLEIEGTEVPENGFLSRRLKNIGHYESYKLTVLAVAENGRTKAVATLKSTTNKYSAIGDFSGITEPTPMTVMPAIPDELLVASLDDVEISMEFPDEYCD